VKRENGETDGKGEPRKMGGRIPGRMLKKLVQQGRSE
jgi:hypothetical protein